MAPNNVLAQARSLLFVPGNRPERFARALAGALKVVTVTVRARPAGCYQCRGSSRYSRASESYSAGASSARAIGRSKKASVATAKNSAGSVAP